MMAGERFLVHGSSCVRDTNLPASPVLHCLMYLVSSDPYLLEILVDDSPPILRGEEGAERKGKKGKGGKEESPNYTV